MGGGLSKSFPKVAEFVKRVRRYNDVYIATAKDRASIIHLLKRYGINIPQERIISVEFSRDKRLQLKEISRLSGKPLSKIVLVEDAVEQLKGAKEIGAKGLLYRRGYSTLAQKKEARKMGMAVVDWTKQFDSRRVKHLTRK
ncbi:MAG: HAD family hydrolase [archaeon]